MIEKSNIMSLNICNGFMLPTDVLVYWLSLLICNTKAHIRMHKSLQLARCASVASDNRVTVCLSILALLFSVRPSVVICQRMCVSFPTNSVCATLPIFSPWKKDTMDKKEPGLVILDACCFLASFHSK